MRSSGQRSTRNGTKSGRPGPAHTAAASAVMCAVLLVAQFVLSFVPGVELVTALLLAFCYLFGIRCGMLTATAFSLLRCFIFGFYPNVIVLYLVYFNAFALFFGWLGGRGRPIAAWVCPVLLAVLAGGAAAAAIAGLPVSALYVPRLKGAAWALFSVMCALLVLYLVLLAGRRKGVLRQGMEAAALASLAALFTVCFTLLDDVITPLFYGYTRDAALGYFYAGFLAMLPQTVSAAVSVFVLFPVLARIFGGARKSPPSNVGRMDKDMV